MQVAGAGLVDTTDELKPKLNLSVALSAVTTYSVFVGMAYLWGYWQPFGINIMDYLGVADVLTASAWPLLSLSGSLLVGMFIGGGDGAYNPSKVDKNSVGRALYWYWTRLRSLHYLGLFLIWMLDVPYKWFLIGLLGGVPLAVYVNGLNWIETLPVQRSLRVFLVLFIIMLPPGAISMGQRNAENIQQGRLCQVVYSDVVGVPLPADAKLEVRPCLIGQRGDTLFMWLPQERRALIAKFSSDHPLIIGRIDGAQPTTVWQWIVGGLANLLQRGR